MVFRSRTVRSERNLSNYVSDDNRCSHSHECITISVRIPNQETPSIVASERPEVRHRHVRAVTDRVDFRISVRFLEVHTDDTEKRDPHGAGGAAKRAHILNPFLHNTGYARS
jgi:hypothetical protein